jgi:hypothetical protein
MGTLAGQAHARQPAAIPDDTRGESTRLGPSHTPGGAGTRAQPAAIPDDTRGESTRLNEPSLCALTEEPRAPSYILMYPD